MTGLSATFLALPFSLLAATCLQIQSPEPTTDLDEARTSNNAAPTATDEPTGEVRDPLPVVSFKRSDFPFVTVVPDDGEGDGGGWQAVKAELSFSRWVIPHLPRRWPCSISIGMPLRTKVAGPIPRSHAATLSVEITQDVASAMNYDLPPGIFCMRFVSGVEALFKSRYVRLTGLGAKVTR